MPPNAPSISQGYNKPDHSSLTLNRKTIVHEGIDVISHVGFPVLATHDGIVKSAYFEPFYGNRIELFHGEDENGRLMLSRYFHLDKRLVSPGDSVKRGQQIATMGRTGILSAGFPHLHFEVRYRDTPGQRLSVPINPHLLWFDGPGRITCYDRKADYSGDRFKTTYPVPCSGTDWQ